MGIALPSWLNNKKQASCNVGIEVTPDGIAIAHVEKKADGIPALLACQFIEGEGDSLVEYTKAAITELKLKGYTANLCLSYMDYSIQVGDSPNVPSEELNTALSFQVKDLIEYPLDDAVVAGFSYPEDAQRGGAPKTFAAAARKSTVMSEVEMISKAGLQVLSVDVPELCLRNITRFVERGQGVAVVILTPNRGSVTFIKNGWFYLSRRFDLNYGGGLLDDLPDEQLVLELQRSSDFYERQLRQPPPPIVLLVGEHITADKVSDDLKGHIQGELDVFDLRQWVDIQCDVPDHVLRQCTLAVGAALREEAESG